MGLYVFMYFQHIMETLQENTLIFIRLLPDEDIIENIQKACEKYQVQTAIVISGIGQLKNIKLGYFKEKEDYAPQTFEKPHELLNLSGTIIKQDDTYLSHLHVSLGNEQKQVIGGHLLGGKINITCEIAILHSTAKVTRKISEKTGLKELRLTS